MPVRGFTMLSTLTDRSGSQEDKRRLILDAAVRVFARKGYHASRVGDIAEEAGVAHGLLYHYFRSKEELLETIFRETWRDVLDAVRAVEETDETARDRLGGVAKILLRAWRRDPDLVRVLVREVTRGSHLQRRIVDRKSTRLNSSHMSISYAVFCLKKKKKNKKRKLQK